jgi:hypothetical protein
LLSLLLSSLALLLDLLIAQELLLLLGLSLLVLRLLSSGLLGVHLLLSLLILLHPLDRNNRSLSRIYMSWILLAQSSQFQRRLSVAIRHLVWQVCDPLLTLLFNCRVVCVLSGLLLDLLRV